MKTRNDVIGPPDDGEIATVGCIPNPESRT
jgi:hypothetical protein